ncbi:hypothetical protein HDZ31DRAFT_76761 [Schizophyllum fasciatum]
MVAHDVDRSVAIAGSRTWTAYTKALAEGGEWDNTAVAVDVSNTLPLPRRAIFDPDGVFSAEQALTTSDPAESEAVEDMQARLRVGALGCLRWIIENLPSENEELLDLLHANQLWTCLSNDHGAFGHDQPAVRRAGWALLQATLKARKDMFRAEQGILRLVLRSGLAELDSNVQGVLWGPLISFLQEYPDVWEPSSPEDDLDEQEPNEGEDVPSEAMPTQQSPLTHFTRIHDAPPFQLLLTFLSLACCGAPVQGYPTVMLMLSTIPSHIMFPEVTTASSPHDTADVPQTDPSDAIQSPTLDTALAPLSDLFTAFWSALPSLSTKGLAQQRLLAQQKLLSSVMDDNSDGGVERVGERHVRRGRALPPRWSTSPSAYGVLGGGGEGADGGNERGPLKTARMITASLLGSASGGVMNCADDARTKWVARTELHCERERKATKAKPAHHAP